MKFRVMRKHSLRLSRDQFKNTIKFAPCVIDVCERLSFMTIFKTEILKSLFRQYSQILKFEY